MVSAGPKDAMTPSTKSYKGMELIIEGDIQGAFNNLNHKKIITLLKKRISDQAFLDLIYKTCTAGIFDSLQHANLDPVSGVPQGGIVSPILWNIYMHEFDKYITTEIKDLFDALNKRQGRDLPGKQATPNRIYNQLLHQRLRLKKLIQLNLAELSLKSIKKCGIVSKVAKPSHPEHPNTYLPYWLLTTKSINVCYAPNLLI
jgi:Reverse transcriptase (RNA-dependent DNA polymerase)